VDKPLSPQAEKTVLEPPKPPSPEDARGSPGTGGAPPSPARVASGHNPMGTSLSPKPAEFLEASPLKPRSYGLRVAGGCQPVRAHPCLSPRNSGGTTHNLSRLDSTSGGS
jgi:hypothetical protein